ncbi:META domain-containing protein [Kribbella sp. VKM Ac-2566]|uniref:META domain-containing protein n=1 Tax=Kribbella sp. VKM Ac-2566 TaxID=2512218 RepID=UPI001064574F|nr:META domain-containing protein [Kribbella sp. VKM Ac-2566]TDW91138.1 META domain-containing protein [Kribbella sp. VKM Ac-2566]
MSNTDLEDDLRGTFERAAASVPQAVDLTERATTGARRAQRRTWVVSGTAAVAVAAIAVAGFGLAGSRNQPTQPPVATGQAPASASATSQVVSAQTVAGTWRPVQMVGAKTLQAARPDDPVLVFKADGTWTGSDGCNGLQGTYSIGQRGAFSATSGPQHLVGCENVPHTGVLHAAKRIAVSADRLQFFGADGRQLASYARAG